MRIFGTKRSKLPVQHLYAYQTALPCCLCRDGSGCLYAVIQTKSRATPEQDRKLTNEAYHDEAGTEQCAQLTLLPSESAPTCREHPRHYPRFVFLFFFFSDSFSAQTIGTRRILLAPYCIRFGWLHSFVD